MPNIASMHVVWLFRTAFWMKLKKAYYRSISLNLKSKKRYFNLKKNWASFKQRQRMKQHLKTKVLDGKTLRLSASSCQQQILHVNKAILGLEVSNMYYKSFIVITVYFWLAKVIWYMIWKGRKFRSF